MPRKRDLIAQLAMADAQISALTARHYSDVLGRIRDDNTPTPAQQILGRAIPVIQGLTDELESLVDAYLRFYRFVQIEFESEPYANGPTSYISTGSELDPAAQRIARAWEDEHLAMMVGAFDVSDLTEICDPSLVYPYKKSAEGSG